MIVKHSLSPTDFDKVKKILERKGYQSDSTQIYKVEYVELNIAKVNLIEEIRSIRKETHKPIVYRKNPMFISNEVKKDLMPKNIRAIHKSEYISFVMTENL